MSTPIELLADETVLSLYTTFGENFWTRVRENNGPDIKPLQQDVNFQGKLNQRTLDFDFAPGEEARAHALFEAINEVFEPTMFRHTPFLGHIDATGAGTKGVRFTYDPGLVRFTFLPEAMETLGELAHRGDYLSAMHNSARILAESTISEDAVEMLEKHNIFLSYTLKTAREAVAQHNEGKCSDKQLWDTIAEALGTKSKPGVSHAISTIEALIVEDPIMIMYRPDINKLKTMESLFQMVCDNFERDAKRAEKARAELMGEKAKL